MFRRPLLPSAFLAIALGGAATVASWPVSAQDRSTQERLDRLERDLNMLQRQVYRGAPAPAGGDPGAAVSAELRINRLEEEIRDLTGRVEEFSNQVDQLRHRVEQINGDMDTRLSQAPPASAALAAAGPPPRSGAVPGGIGAGPRSRSPEPLQSDSGGLAPPAVLMPPGTPMPPPPGGPVPTPIFGTLTPPGAPPTSPEQAAANAARTGAARTGAVGPTSPPGPARSANTPAEQYNQAFSLLKQADYPAAETALRAFVEQHPKDPMAGSAQYWLGETYYTRGKYMEAAAMFAEGYKRYPKSAKAAEELLKLGMALARANQTKNACVALAQLDHDFPNPGATIKQRSDTERKRLGC